jgi:hypothetical protein
MFDLVTAEMFCLHPVKQARLYTPGTKNENLNKYNDLDCTPEPFKLILNLSSIRIGAPLVNYSCFRPGFGSWLWALPWIGRQNICTPSIFDLIIGLAWVVQGTSAARHPERRKIHPITPRDLGDRHFRASIIVSNHPCDWQGHVLILSCCRVTVRGKRDRDGYRRCPTLGSGALCFQFPRSVW